MRGRPKIKLSTEQLKYISDNWDSLTQAEIADDLCVSVDTVSKAIKNMGIKSNRKLLHLNKKSTAVQKSLAEFGEVAKAIRTGKKIIGNYCPYPTCYWLGGYGNNRTCFWSDCVVVAKKGPERPES